MTDCHTELRAQVRKGPEIDLETLRDDLAVLLSKLSNKHAPMQSKWANELDRIVDGIYDDLDDELLVSQPSVISFRDRPQLTSDERKVA